MNELELERYSRHILLKEMGQDAQQRITQANILMIGAGGLGSPAALYLAASGVGSLTIADDDVVDVTNLQRQIIHSTDRVGINKALSAKQSLYRLNPLCHVTAITNRINEQSLHQLVAKADVVLDCSDNFKTRLAINNACMKVGIPLVSGAAVGFDGQISVYDPRNVQCPCYACLFPQDQHFEDIRASDIGVFSPLVGMIGTMQAAEALKLISGVGQPLTGKLMMLDARTMQFTEIAVERDPNCPICSKRNCERL